MRNDRNRSRQSGQSSNSYGPPPYNFVSFPNDPPSTQEAVGHEKYLSDYLHGTLSLVLEVKTAVHISTGIAVMGSDIDRPKIDLIKTMVQSDRRLLIQGSSLKGCIRSIYEAITNSRLGVAPKKQEDIERGKYPKNRLPCKKIDELCPTSAVFGASGEKWGWQSLTGFQDAYCESVSTFETGFMPSLWSPKPEKCDAYFKNESAAGRKFYYHMTHALDKGSAEQGIPVQQAGQIYRFTTEISFKNLKPEEIGVLLIVLGQHPNYPLALKIGGGKPIGMGTMTTTITDINLIRDFNAHYSSYEAQFEHLSGKDLNDFIQRQIEKADEKQLVQSEQLQEIYRILGYGKTEITRPPYERYSWKPPQRKN